MCLSVAYVKYQDEQKKICEYVSNVLIDGETVRLTDIMGAETSVRGTFKGIDLVKNNIYIESTEKVS